MPRKFRLALLSGGVDPVLRSGKGAHRIAESLEQLAGRAIGAGPVFRVPLDADGEVCGPDDRDCLDGAVLGDGLHRQFRREIADRLTVQRIHHNLAGPENVGKAGAFPDEDGLADHEFLVAIAGIGLAVVVAVIELVLEPVNPKPKSAKKAAPAAAAPAAEEAPAEETPAEALAPEVEEESTDEAAAAGAESPEEGEAAEAAAEDAVVDAPAEDDAK